MPDMSSSTNNPEIKRVADEIENYLTNHPNAADTAEGIINWWFLKQQYDISSQLVQQALDYLVLNSVLEFKTNLSGHKIYSSKETKT